MIEHPHECEAAEGCINEMQGICFRCGENFCSMHAGFAAHDCIEPASFTAQDFYAGNDA